ncbi:O-methyltransferase [Aeromonas hydrophila]|nr:O-methyltransferase [Aeromonas hydrophila]
MNHYQADPYNALEAISEAQKIAFGPMLFQASWCLRETGVLAYLETRGSRGPRWPTSPRRVSSANTAPACCWTWGSAADSAI